MVKTGNWPTEHPLPTPTPLPPPPQKIAPPPLPPLLQYQLGRRQFTADGAQKMPKKVGGAHPRHRIPHKKQKKDF